MSRITREKPQQPCPSCKRSSGGVRKRLRGFWNCMACGARLKGEPK